MKLPHDVDPSVVFYADHLTDMDRAIRGAFNSYTRMKHSALSPAAANRCREELKPVFRLLPASWRNLESDEESLVQLTTQQQQVMNGLRDNPRLTVRGGAGAGKTMLAFWRAVTFVREGMSVLLLCFNSGLAEWLNHRADMELEVELRNNVRISTFHSLCRHFHDLAGVPFQPPSRRDEAQQFWNADVPNTMFDSILDQVAEPRFDAIIVDEA
ncbi:MAG: AAA family ATPase [Planctomycetaceae bacterium]